MGQKQMRRQFQKARQAFKKVNKDWKKTWYDVVHGKGINKFNKDLGNAFRHGFNAVGHGLVGVGAGENYVANLTGRKINKSIKHTNKIFNPHGIIQKRLRANLRHWFRLTYKKTKHWILKNKKLLINLLISIAVTVGVAILVVFAGPEMLALLGVDATFFSSLGIGTGVAEGIEVAEAEAIISSETALAESGTAIVDAEASTNILDANVASNILRNDVQYAIDAELENDAIAQAQARQLVWSKNAIPQAPPMSSSAFWTTSAQNYGAGYEGANAGAITRGPYSTAVMERNPQGRFINYILEY